MLTSLSREFQRALCRNRHRPHKTVHRPPPRLLQLATQVRLLRRLEAMSLLICLRLRLKQVRTGQALAALAPAMLRPALAALVRSMLTAWTSCATTLSSSSSDKSYNSSRRCSSPFCNKWAQEILS